MGGVQNVICRIYGESVDTEAVAASGRRLAILENCRRLVVGKVEDVRLLRSTAIKTKSIAVQLYYMRWCVAAWGWRAEKERGLTIADSLTGLFGHGHDDGGRVFAGALGYDQAAVEESKPEVAQQRSRR